MRTLLLVVAGCTAFVGMVTGVVLTGPGCGDCNVVYISVDPLRADHMGVYGYERNTTPHIDALAQDAYVFERAHAQSLHTTVSLFSTFSSLYPSQHGMVPGRQQVPDVTMLAEVFQQRGFSTLSLNGGGRIRAEYGFDRGFDDYISSFETGRPGPDILSADAQFDRLSGALDGRGHERFFLFFQSFIPHDPYLPPDRYDLWGNGSVGIEADADARWTSLRREALAGNRSLTEAFLRFRDYIDRRAADDPAVRRRLVDLYDGELRAVDARVGRLVGLLRRRGELDETIIVVGSQHGEMLGEHDQYIHEALYEEVVRVPLIVRMPNMTGQERIDQVVENVDVGPMLLDLVLRGPGPVYDAFMGQAVGDSLVPAMLRGVDVEDPVLAAHKRQRAFIEPSSGMKLYINGSQRRVFELTARGEEELLEGAEDTVERLYDRYRSIVADLEKYGEELPGQWPYAAG